MTAKVRDHYATTPTIFDTRPLEVDPQWWYRASWLARQNAVIASMKRAEQARARMDALKAEQRRAIEEQLLAAEKARSAGKQPQQHGSAEARITVVKDMLAQGKSEPEILLHLGIRAATLSMTLRRASLFDLARRFDLYRRADERKPCPDCHRTCSRQAKRCGKCAQAARMREAS